MSSFRQWLEHNGLAAHADLLDEHEVDFDVLPELEEADLEKIGLGLGSRKKLMKAIRELTGHGAPDLPGAPRPGSPARPTTAGDAERRQLTIMFADLVGSTELSQRLDPEDLREINRAYQDAAKAAIDRFGGYVARYMGDGVLAYFGFPRAHEDDAERAVRAGLALADAVPRLDTEFTLAVRIGVATGPVVVGDLIGDGASQESAVVGETPNLAARLQGIADPNTVVLSAATRHLVYPRFDLDALGLHSLKGMGRPVPAYRAVAVRGVSRFDASSERRLTPLVGRDEELGMLLRRWELARDGEGQVVLLCAEAGVGKSRIVRALDDALAQVPTNRVLYYCSPYHRASAFHPAIEQLERAFRFTPGQTPTERLRALERTLGDLGLDAREAGPVLAELLAIPYEGVYPKIELSPELLRQRTLDVIVDSVEAMAASRPVVFVVEDAHWVDPSTQDLLTHLIERIRKRRVLVVITHRPEHAPVWTDYPHATTLTLNNLGRRDSVSMMTEVTGGLALAPSMIDALIERTDGVPLFIEEITAAIIDSRRADESGASGAPGIIETTDGIPATLHDLLMERLDRTGPAKEVAQLAAVIGRTFTFELLCAVAERGEQALRRDLEHLVESGLVYGHGNAHASYDFKHALVRDVAYQSLLTGARRDFHGRIARSLVRLAADNPPLELIAHHFGECAEFDQAARYWRQAGDRALRRFAHVEANALFERALEATRSLAETEEWMRFELETQTALGPSQMYVLGQGAPEVEQTYARALHLGERLGDPHASFTAAWGLWRLQFARGDMVSARDSAVNCEHVSAEATDHVAMLGTAFALGATALFGGDSGAAAPLLERSVALYRTLEDKRALAAFGQDPGLSALGYLAWARWALGRPDLAVEASEEGVRLARETGKPVLVAVATGFAGMTYALRRDVDQLTTYAEECLSICELHQFRQWAAMGNVLVAYACSLRAEHARAARLAEAGLAEKVALQSYIALPWMCHLTAETHLAASRPDQALDAARRGIEFASRGGERFCESENHRIRGVILAGTNSASDEAVHASFRRALCLAGDQPSFSLRAATSYARFLQAQGASRRARELLAPIYGSFTEGLDTLDLKDAQTLLGELGPVP